MMHIIIIQKKINALQNEYGISGICNVANEIEFELVHQKQLFYSCGVHPWNASLDTFESMLPLLKKAPIIGEIGMDSVWCDLDLNIQKEVFEKQLQLAYALNKPVILHTKGQEKTILEFVFVNIQIHMLYIGMDVWIMSKNMMKWYLISRLVLQLEKKRK